MRLLLPGLEPATSLSFLMHALGATFPFIELLKRARKYLKLNGR